MTKNNIKYPNNLDYWEYFISICSNTDKIKIILNIKISFYNTFVWIR